MVAKLNLVAFGLPIIFMVIESIIAFLTEEYRGIIVGPMILSNDPLPKFDVFLCYALEVICAYITYFTGSLIFVSFIICIPTFIGFSKTGIRKGSYASRWQYLFKGYIPRGSCFGKIHRLGMIIHKKLTNTVLLTLYAVGHVVVFYIRLISLH